MPETISCQDVHASTLRLRGEDVLIRTTPAETVRASGLVLPHTPATTALGHVIYGVVVGHGPGRVITHGKPVSVWIVKTFAGLPPVPVVRAFATEEQARDYRETCIDGDEPEEVPVQGRRPETVVPPPWKIGDHVVCRSGFGVELNLAEGVHYLVGRGAAEHGHGVIATWTPGHVHCWHYGIGLSPGDSRSIHHYACACGETRDDHTLDTSLPTCLECPPGPRVAEAVLGVRVQKLAASPGPTEFERQGGFEELNHRIEAMRPTDRRDDPDIRRGGL